MARPSDIDAGAVADHGLVSAAPTWRRIERLLREGFTEQQLAERLGYRTPHLQLGRRRVLAKTAQRIERFYRSIMVGGEEA